METEKIKVLIEMINSLIKERKSKLDLSSSQEQRNKFNIEIGIYETFLNTLPSDVNYIDLYSIKDSVFAMYSKYLSMYEDVKKQNTSNSETLNSKLDNYEINYNSYLNLHSLIDSFLNGVTLINTSYSNNIILNLMRYNNNQDEVLYNEIYDLIERRRKVSVIKYGEEILLDLITLESLENRISKINDNKIDSYSLNKKEYRKSLLDCIKAINEYYFLDYKESKYYKKNNSISEKENNKIIANKIMNYIKKYYNLINSVTKNKVIIIDVDNKKISTDNLLSYLSIYNIDSDYEVFKEKLKNKKINNTDFIKDEYKKQINYLNKCIDYLCNYTLDKIKNDSVLVVDSTKDKDDLVYERDELINKINNSERND